MGLETLVMLNQDGHNVVRSGKFMNMAEIPHY